MSDYFLFTVDVEDWFQVENFRPYFPVSSWEAQKCRVEKNTRFILEILDAFRDISGVDPGSFSHPKITATFFILGWLAERFPSLVREIHARGHEVASHGYSHQLCAQMPSKKLKTDLMDSKKLLEDLIGEPVIGYRAPSFSISDEILEMIQTCGYIYDSSYNSFALNERYGRVHEGGPVAGIARRIGPSFHEIPISNLKVGRFVFPLGGGGYFRLFPYLLSKIGIQQILKKQDAYMFYMHPWEIDTGQPRVTDASRLSRFRHYVNIPAAAGKLSRLFNDFRSCRFVSCRMYLSDMLGVGNDIR